MDWIAARSYYIGYSSIDRFDSLIFFYCYFSSWSIGIFCCLILPILYLFAPKSLETTRTSHLLILSLICLSYMLFNFLQPLILTGSGEPNLSYHNCRFVVYLSTFAKPFSLYLTLLFSVERIFKKILSNFILHTSKQRLLFKRFYFICIFIGIAFILSIRLYEIIKFIKIDQLIMKNISREDMNSTYRVLSFTHCYRSMDIHTYAKVLSFYVIQYWYEYFILTIIALSLISILIYQYALPRFQQRSSSRLSINTKFYLSLSSYVILFELLLLLLHSIVDDITINNTDTQVNYLQIMLFVYNLRCILFPLIICITCCNPLKEFFSDIFIRQPYLINMNENDQIDSIIDRSEIVEKNMNNEHLVL